jgi:hypothetical protein
MHLDPIQLFFVEQIAAVGDYPVVTGLDEVIVVKAGPGYPSALRADRRWMICRNSSVSTVSRGDR